MPINGRLFVWAMFAFVCAAAGAQSPRQNQDARQIVAQAVRAELAADAADHSLWLYYEVDRKPENGVVQWAAQTRMGEVDRVLQQDGRQLTLDEQRKKMQSFINDESAQAKQRKSGQHDDKQATEMLNLLPQAFIWTKVRQQGGTTYLHFRPDPNFRPPTWESRVFAAMEGEMAVDDAEHRIVSLRGKLISEVKFGWGLLGSLEPGGTFNVERRRVGRDVWQITETHVHIQGRALLFKTISQNEDDVKSKFEELPSDTNLQAAEQKLMTQQ
jgi:hypothetical protein